MFGASDCKQTSILALLTDKPQVEDEERIIRDAEVCVPDVHSFCLLHHPLLAAVLFTNTMSSIGMSSPQFSPMDLMLLRWRRLKRVFPYEPGLYLRPAEVVQLHTLYFTDWPPALSQFNFRKLWK